MNSYILVPIMVATIGSALAKCSVKSTVHEVARTAESAAVNKVVAIEAVSKKNHIADGRPGRRGGIDKYH